MRCIYCVSQQPEGISNLLATYVQQRGETHVCFTLLPFIANGVICDPAWVCAMLGESEGQCVSCEIATKLVNATCCATGCIHIHMTGRQIDVMM